MSFLGGVLHRHDVLVEILQECVVDARLCLEDGEHVEQVFHLASILGRDVDEALDQVLRLAKLGQREHLLAPEPGEARLGRPPAPQHLHELSLRVQPVRLELDERRDEFQTVVRVQIGPPADAAQPLGRLRVRRRVRSGAGARPRERRGDNLRR